MKATHILLCAITATFFLLLGFQLINTGVPVTPKEMTFLKWVSIGLIVSAIGAVVTFFLVPAEELENE